MDASFLKSVVGFLVGNGEIFFEMVGLDEKLHLELEEGQRCGGGMQFGGGAKVLGGQGDT